MTDSTLREQIFEALARLHIEHTPDCVHCRLRTAAVLPVVQAREAELTRRAEETERALAVQVGLYRSAENDVTELIQRAEQAESALAAKDAEIERLRDDLKWARSECAKADAENRAACKRAEAAERQRDDVCAMADAARRVATYWRDAAMAGDPGRNPADSAVAHACACILSALTSPEQAADVLRDLRITDQPKETRA